MKKMIVAFALTMFLVAALLLSCTSSSEKVENAENKLTQAQDNLNEAINDSIEDYQVFRKEADMKLAAQEKIIAEFKARIANEKKENRAEYEKKIAELEQQKYDMKMKLDEFKQDGKDSWTNFKSEFVRDMENLGKAINDLTIKNNKK